MTAIKRQMEAGPLSTLALTIANVGSVIKWSAWLFTDCRADAFAHYCPFEEAKERYRVSILAWLADEAVVSCRYDEHHTVSRPP